MVADVIWPIEVLKPSAGKSKVTAATVGGGRSLSGLEQIIQNDAGFWRLTMANIVIRSHQHVRLWNALEAILQGRSGTVLVPMIDCGRQPWPFVDGHAVTSYGQIPFSDGALFNDGTGFYQPVIEATVLGTIAARATSGTLHVTYGGEVMAGMHFSVGERAYRIKRVSGTVESGDIVTYDITFWPPAREAMSDGADIDFDRPKFRARLATDTEMDMDPDMLVFARPTLNFVEDV